MIRIRFKTNEKFKGIVEEVFVKPNQLVEVNQPLAIISTQFEKLRVLSEINGVIHKVYIKDSNVIGHGEAIFDILTEEDIKKIANKKRGKDSKKLLKEIVNSDSIDGIDQNISMTMRTMVEKKNTHSDADLINNIEIDNSTIENLINDDEEIIKTQFGIDEMIDESLEFQNNEATRINDFNFAPNTNDDQTMFMLNSLYKDTYKKNYSINHEEDVNSDSLWNKLESLDMLLKYELNSLSDFEKTMLLNEQAKENMGTSDQAVSKTIDVNQKQTFEEFDDANILKVINRFGKNTAGASMEMIDDSIPNINPEILNNFTHKIDEVKPIKENDDAEEIKTLISKVQNNELEKIKQKQKEQFNKVKDSVINKMRELNFNDETLDDLRPYPDFDLTNTNDISNTSEITSETNTTNHNMYLNDLDDTRSDTEYIFKKVKKTNSEYLFQDTEIDNIPLKHEDENFSKPTPNIKNDLVVPSSSVSFIVNLSNVIKFYLNLKAQYKKDNRKIKFSSVLLSLLNKSVSKNTQFLSHSKSMAISVKNNSGFNYLEVNNQETLNFEEVSNKIHIAKHQGVGLNPKSNSFIVYDFIKSPLHSFAPSLVNDQKSAISFGQIMKNGKSSNNKYGKSKVTLVFDPKKISLANTMKFVKDLNEVFLNPQSAIIK